MGLSKGLQRKLQICQNKVVRFILDLGPREHVGQDELDKVGYLSTSDRAKQIILNHMFNVIHGTAPSYLCQNFQLLHHRYVTRNSQYNFFVPRVKGIDQANFSYQGVKAWNSLPESIKAITSKQLFKRKVKQHLVSQAHAVEDNDFIYY